MSKDKVYKNIDKLREELKREYKFVCRDVSTSCSISFSVAISQRDHIEIESECVAVTLEADTKPVNLK